MDVYGLAAKILRTLIVIYCSSIQRQQLGLRHDHDVPKYQAVKLYRDKNDNVRQLVNAKAIAAGAMSSYAIDQQQRVCTLRSRSEF